MTNRTAIAIALDACLESGDPFLRRAAAQRIGVAIERAHFSPVEAAQDLGATAEQLRAWCALDALADVLGSNTSVTVSNSGVNASNTRTGVEP